MRNIIVFQMLVLLCLCIQTSSQPFDYDRDNFILTKLYYSNSLGEKGITTYLNNPDDLIYKAVWQLEDKSRYSENYFDYRDNRLLKLRRYFSDTLYVEKEFLYEKERLVAESFSNSKGVKGNVKYLYNDTGQLTEMRCAGLNGWFYGNLIYTYEEGKKSHASILKNDSLVGTVSFLYSEEGNLLEEIWDFTGRWKQVFRYEYIARGKKCWANSNPLISLPPGYYISREHYTYNNKMGGFSYFTYGPDGSLQHKTFVRSDSLRTETDLFYDKGIEIRGTSRKYSNGMTADFDFSYQNGKIVEKSYLRNDGLRGREAFLYDINGKLLSARYDNMDAWLSGNLYFNHDLFDRVISARFISDQGDSADIIFDLNKAGLPESITWNFSSGDMQKYTFTYSTGSE